MKKILCVVLVTMVLLAAPASYALAAYNEAPILQQRVAAGELPPVEERLPVNPLVIEPFEEIGVYGGIVRSAHRGPSDATGYFRMVREPLVNFDNMLIEIQPNLAERWDVSEDGTEITFHLREGLKWSDGHPFTTDDIMFWWEVQNTREIFPAGVGVNWLAGGVPVEVIQVSDLTVTFKWAVPYAAFVNWLAAGQETYLPKHYLSQFHANYTDVDELTALAKDEGYSDWGQLFVNRSGERSNFRALGSPTMDAWYITTNFDAPILISERNPYYFKVDTEGNQLPYVNTLHRILVEDIEVMKLMLMAGEIDYITRNLWTTYSDLPMYIANQERGDYRIINTHGGTPGALNLMFNANYDEDSGIAELINNYEFKKALSYAIDRDEINDVRFNGLARSGHGHFHYENPGYVEEVDQRYVDYNPDLANQILDELGLTQRDSQGFRLRPDGTGLTLIIDGSTHHQHHSAGGELIKSYFEDVGIRTVLNVIDRGLYEAKREGNQSMISFADLADPLIPLEQTGHKITYVMAPLWELWFESNGTQGVEPPADVIRLMDIFNTLAPATSDVEARAAYMQEIAQIWGDNFWTIGTVGVPFNLSFAKNNLRNVPADGAHSHPANPAIYRPYQWFWK